MEKSVVNVSVIRHQVRANQLKFSARKTSQHLALRPDNLPKMKHLLLDLNDAVEGLFVRMGQSFVFEFGDFERQLIQRRFVILNDGIKQRMRNPIGSPGNVHGASETAVCGSLDTLERNIVVGDQKIFTQKKIQFTGRKHPIPSAVVNRVDHDKKIWGKSVLFLRLIFLHFGRRSDHYAVLDRERMEMENVLQNELGFLRSRFF